MSDIKWWPMEEIQRGHVSHCYLLVKTVEEKFYHAPLCPKQTIGHFRLSHFPCARMEMAHLVKKMGMKLECDHGSN